MTTIPAGAPYTLESTWKAGPGGPGVDLTGVTITITRLSDLAVIVAETSTGIVHAATGLYLYVWTPVSDASGQFLAVWKGVDPDTDHVPAYEIVTVGAPTPITLDEVIEYIGEANLTRFAVEVDEVITYPQVQDALNAEAVTQLGKCTYPVPTVARPNPDLSALHEALKRRVQRNLAMRPLSLGSQVNEDSGMVIRPPNVDSEIRRFEAPYRKRTFG